MSFSNSPTSHSSDGHSSSANGQVVSGLKDDETIQSDLSLVMDVTKKENLITKVLVQRDKTGKLHYSINKQAQSALEGTFDDSPTLCDRMLEDSVVRDYVPKLSHSNQKKDASKSRSGQLKPSDSDSQCGSSNEAEEDPNESVELVFDATATGEQDKKHRHKEKRRKYRERKKNKKRLEKIHEATQEIYQETLFNLPTLKKQLPIEEKPAETAQKGPQEMLSSPQLKRTSPKVEPVLISTSNVKLPQVLQSEVRIAPRRIDYVTVPVEPYPGKSSPADSFRTVSSSIDPIEGQTGNRASDEGVKKADDDGVHSTILFSTPIAPAINSPPSSPTSKIFRRPPGNMMVRTPSPKETPVSTSPATSNEPTVTNSASSGLFETVSPVAKHRVASLGPALSQKRKPKQQFPTAEDFNSILSGKVVEKSPNSSIKTKETLGKLKVTTEPQNSLTEEKVETGKKKVSKSPPKSRDYQSLKSNATNSKSATKPMTSPEDVKPGDQQSCPDGEKSKKITETIESAVPVTSQPLSEQASSQKLPKSAVPKAVSSKQLSMKTGSKSRDKGPRLIINSAKGKFHSLHNSPRTSSTSSSEGAEVVYSLNLLKKSNEPKQSLRLQSKRKSLDDETTNVEKLRKIFEPTSKLVLATSPSAKSAILLSKLPPEEPKKSPAANVVTVQSSLTNHKPLPETVAAPYENVQQPSKEKLSQRTSNTALQTVPIDVSKESPFQSLKDPNEQTPIQSPANDADKTNAVPVNKPKSAVTVEKLAEQSPVVEKKSRALVKVEPLDCKQTPPPDLKEDSIPGSPPDPTIKPYLMFYLKQEDFLRSMEECQPQASTEDSGQVPQQPIESEGDLIACQENLMKRQEQFVDRAKIGVKRSDSFAQLIQDTSGGHSGAGAPSPANQVQVNPPRSNVKFYVALAVVICLLFASKYLSFKFF